MSNAPSANGRRSPLASMVARSGNPLQIPSGVVELSLAEVDADQRNVEARTQGAEQLAIAAADLEDRNRPVRRQAIGQPVSPERARLLAFLFAEIVLTAAKRPVQARIARTASSSSRTASGPEIASEPCARCTAGLVRARPGRPGREAKIESEPSGS